MGLRAAVLLAVVAGAQADCTGAWSIDAFGAVPSLDTPAQATANGHALAQALAKANQSDVRSVVIPAGAVYSYLPSAPDVPGLSNVTLCVEGTLRLYTANFSSVFPGWPSNPWDMLSFSGCNKLRIVSETGGGLVDGRGSEWWWYKLLHGGQRPQLLVAGGCQDMELTGVGFLNAPNYHVSLRDQLRLTIRDVTVLVDLDTQVEVLAYAHGVDASSASRHEILAAMAPSASAPPRPAVGLPRYVMDYAWAPDSWAVNPPFPMVYALNTGEPAPPAQQHGAGGRLGADRPACRRHGGAVRRLHPPALDSRPLPPSTLAPSRPRRRHRHLGPRHGGDQLQHHEL